MQDRPALLWSQLSLRLHTYIGILTVPAGAVVWLPAWTRFSLPVPVPSSCQLLLLDPAIGRLVSRKIAVLAPEPLLLALLAEARSRPLRRDVPEDRRLMGVLLDRVRAARVLPLVVRSTTRTRFERFIPRGVGEEPPSISTLAASIGCSRRTVERAFVREVGDTAGRWRRQARWARALDLLGEGLAVKEVAMRVGYRSPSAFVAAFRRALGTTPKQLARRASSNT